MSKELKPLSPKTDSYTKEVMRTSSGKPLTWGELDKQIAFQKEQANQKLRIRRYI